MVLHPGPPDWSLRVTLKKMILGRSTPHIGERVQIHLCQFPIFHLWYFLRFNIVFCMSIFATMMLQSVDITELLATQLFHITSSYSKEGKVLMLSFIIPKG